MWFGLRAVVRALEKLWRKNLSIEAQVAISGRRVEKLSEAAQSLSSDSAKVLPVVCDVTDAERVTEAVAEVVAHFGKLDIVVANAGFGVAGKFERITPDQWKGQFDTNVLGVVHTFAGSHARGV